MSRIPQLGSRGQPEQTRKAILQAAIGEFSKDGVAGARTDKIAQAAGVNKALLYYYFHDKEELYGAVLDSVFSGLVERVVPIFERDLSPGEKIMTYAAAHFDYISEHLQYPRLVQAEMMRASTSESPHIARIVQNCMKPVFVGVLQTLTRGIASAEFRQVDPMQTALSLVAVNVFYFTSTPMVRVFVKWDPLGPEAIRNRRRAALDFIAAALFRDPKRAPAMVDQLMANYHAPKAVPRKSSELGRRK